MPVSTNYDFLKAVEESFEQDLHQAILLSKLTYEEQLVNAAKTEKDQEQNKKTGKKKKSTMSLEEFNSRGTSVAAPGPVLTEPVDSKPKGIIDLN